RTRPSTVPASRAGSSGPSLRAERSTNTLPPDKGGACRDMSGWDILGLSPGDALLWAAVGYLLGSIPFGVILTRLAGLGDVRTIGPGNIGATNVLRTGRKDIAAATLLGDALKGT